MYFDLIIMSLLEINRHHLSQPKNKRAYVNLCTGHTFPKELVEQQQKSPEHGRELVRICVRCIENHKPQDTIHWDTWVALWVKCLTLGFSSGHDLRVMKSAHLKGPCRALCGVRLSHSLLLYRSTSLSLK